MTYTLDQIARGLRSITQAGGERLQPVTWETAVEAIKREADDSGTLRARANRPDDWADMTASLRAKPEGTNLDQFISGQIRDLRREVAVLRKALSLIRPKYRDPALKEAQEWALGGSQLPPDTHPGNTSR